MAARVLVVDDDEAVARTVARLLGARGYEVTVVNDAAAAFVQLHDHDYDAVVLDFQLGDTTANQLLGDLGGLGRAAKLPAVLVLSGTIGVGDTVAAMKLGVGDVIQKPFAAEELAGRLERLVSRSAAARTVPIPVLRGKRATMSKLGSYEVKRLLASGGMCAVYVGEHAITGSRVALKMLDPQFAARPDIIDRLLGELEVSKRIDHPAVVKVMQGERTRDGLPFLVLELVDGQSLTTILDQRGWLPPRTVIAIAAQLASAMAAVHAANIGHADLKPDNVLVLAQTGADGEPLIKLIDFGVAYFADRPPPTEPMVWGTPQYLAPEQWMGKPALASDVYALGCLVYEMAVGSAPFTGSVAELAIAHIEHEAPHLAIRAPDMTALDPIVARTLAKKPAARPTMAELAAELEALREPIS